MTSVGLRRALMVVAFCLAGVGVSRPASAAFVYTELVHDDNAYLMYGYTVTSLDPWEIFPSEFFYNPCECWIRQENYAGTAGALFTPGGQLAAITPIIWSPIESYLPLQGFRPWQVGVWLALGDHYIDSWYWYADWPYEFIGTQSAYLGRTQRTASVTCIVPTGEQTISQGWANDIGQPTIHKFMQRLLPTNANFAGSRVTEYQPSPGTDACWHPDMAPLQPGPYQLSGGNWGIVAGNYWDAPDYVGFGTAALQQTRTVRASRGLPMPCQIVVPQQMWITTCNGAPVYQTHNIRITIDTSTIFVERAGVGATQTWPQGPPPPPPGGSDSLTAGQRLYAWDQRVSSNGQYTLVYQGDGNLVLYGPGGPVWATMTFDAPGYVEMQGDGNFVMYNSSGTPIWHSATPGHGGAYIVVQNDGYAVIYSSTGVQLWSS